MTGRPIIDWEWIGGHGDEILRRVLEHLTLTAIALGVGLVFAFALAAAGLRWPRSLAPITAAAAALYTIPSLALFAFLVPLTGFTVLTAEIGLVSYTLLILVRSVVAGIRGVDADVVEAASGLGFGRWRRLLTVEVPLALPTIMAGIRIAAVTTVGLVTVTALIGMGGVGFFILRGLQRFFDTEIVVGTALAVLLAVGIDVTLALVTRMLTPWVGAGGRR